MESKYKERAKAILDSGQYKPAWNSIQNFDSDTVINAMCQLANEVACEETTALSHYTKMISTKLYFDKERVEELLQKQRELCYQKADYLINGTYCKEDGIEIDRDSILNAKLKID